MAEDLIGFNGSTPKAEVVSRDSQASEESVQKCENFISSFDPLSTSGSNSTEASSPCTSTSSAAQGQLGLPDAIAAAFAAGKDGGNTGGEGPGVKAPAAEA